MKTDQTEHVIICGGLIRGGAPGSFTGFNLWPSAGPLNVELNIADMNAKFCRTVPPRFSDLLEIATYIYTGDQMFRRGGLDVDNFGSRWRRRFDYHIPVREPDFWNSDPAKTVLRETVEFLSDDFYDFTFYPGTGAPEIQQYLQFDTSGSSALPPEQVMMFSGGLDSFAGAIEEIITNKRRAVLVNHRSTDKFNTMHEELNRLLLEKAGAFQPKYLRVEINKKMEAKDYFQRVRSFLYAALGGTVAMMLGLRNLRFYENGVLSLNLPVCGQVVGARATRTTHPRVIAGYQKLLTLLAQETFVVENPFIRQTKGEVVKRIVDAGCGALMPFSRSCAHTWQSSNDEPQCGTCSQCLDRRLAVLAVGAEQHDPIKRYKVDVFTQPRPTKEDKILGAGFIERANQIAAMRDSSEFLCRYPEVLRALRYVGQNSAASAEQIFNLHKKHATEVKGAVQRLVQQHSVEILERTLPGECLLRSVCESGSVTSLPVAAANGDEASSEHGVAASPNEIVTRGSLRYRTGFEDLWLGNTHYDLRGRTKARLCIQFLMEQKAFDANSARHLIDEIDPFVRERGNFLRAADIKIDHYFNDHTGKLPRLRKELIAAAGRNGRYFLKVE